MRWAWALGLILLASSSLARAQEPALTWQAPEVCPSREAWLSLLRARVDPDAWRQAAPKLRAAVRIERAATGYALQLDTELDGAVGQRRLEGALCGELVEASALIVALAIDPQAAERAVSAAPIVAPDSAAPAPAPVAAEAATLVEPAPAPAEQPPVPAREPEPAPKPEPPPKRVVPPVPNPQRWDPERPAQPERESPSTRFFIRPLALLDSATLPKLAFGPSLQGGVRFDRLSLELGASYLIDQSLADPSTDDTIGDLSWFAGSAGACYSALRSGRLGVAPCGRVELGWLWGHGRNLDTSALGGGALWLAFVPGVALAFELVRWLSIDAELAAALPVLPFAFTVGGVGEVHESPSVTVRLSLGFSLRF